MSGHDLIEEMSPNISGHTEENRLHLSHDKRCPVRDTIWAPSGYIRQMRHRPSEATRQLSSVQRA
jgi:hypothetical protein